MNQTALLDFSRCRRAGDLALTPIVGVSNAERLDEAIAEVSIVLTDEQRQWLDTAA